MKTLLTLLLISISSICFCQTITLIDYKLTDTKLENCTYIALQFNPTIKTGANFDTVAYVQALLPLDRFDHFKNSNWKFSDRCKKIVEVRLFNKDYTFNEFRKLFY